MGKWTYRPIIFDLVTRWRWVGQLHASAALPPGKQLLDAHWIWGWVGPGVSLDGIEKRKSYPCWKIAGSIPDEVIVFFNLRNPSSRSMALGSTQPLTEMSTRNLPRAKGRPARRLTTSMPPVSRLARECGSLDISQPCGPLQLVTGLALPFFIN
jgi:hypothetical protein